MGKDHKPVTVAALKPDKTAPVVPVNTEGIPQQEAERIAKMEAEDWSAPSMDHEIQNAIANEMPLRGRVTKLDK
jgi:hypothetical protein